MLARGPDGVVLVSGAIPGERVRARVERTARRMTWAHVEEVVEASPARRGAAVEAPCGGLVYSHIDYPTQLQCKRDIVIDAFRRVGRIALEEAVDVVASPEHGYRWRARFHLRDDRAGFFREGTHSLCDPAPTGQLTSDAVEAVANTVEWLGPAAGACEELTLAENHAGTQRVLHLGLRPGAQLGDLRLSDAAPDGVSGITAHEGERLVALAGDLTHVTDTAKDLWGDTSPLPPSTAWERRAPAFFQSNRFLTASLVEDVLRAGSAGRVADLYAGVGLFAVACAAAGATVMAVEGDPVSGADLETNAAYQGGRVTVQRVAVEDALRQRPEQPFDAVIVDPPRTGLSPEALAGVLRVDAQRLVYVSCDPATLARDAGVLTGAAYRIECLRVFDLFPNTAHVETVVHFVKLKTEN